MAKNFQFDPNEDAISAVKRIYKAFVVKGGSQSGVHFTRILDAMSYSLANSLILRHAIAELNTKNGIPAEKLKSVATRYRFRRKKFKDCRDFLEYSIAEGKCDICVIHALLESELIQSENEAEAEAARTAGLIDAYAAYQKLSAGEYIKICS